MVNYSYRCYRGLNYSLFAVVDIYVITAFWNVWW